uniref:Uncharacterized protein n=1 Tax=uncultured marine virus TaxID=186617 RepID=A0A0F7L1L8_9VIRU|nr:hypothetical protein [uncultured marine virus]
MCNHQQYSQSSYFSSSFTIVAITSSSPLVFNLLGLLTLAISSICSVVPTLIVNPPSLLVCLISIAF